ncbi:LysM peptidoglycan-binding domain-containing protein [Lysobacter pythonis]|uniref:LysM peptidoglycan-binding domain-containing protein n=1 Tax=Solilutibacter pythonis TaxID=2483112 RepID=A0A3M2HF49_9GAMM|nr:peptidoglycan DD-metalloendopeptidase family protein [Lysobacter pythonis]RMH88361.1 LysM peptidoglycan-binding domain-containing protein [Lysobacter pythonis]
MKLFPSLVSAPRLEVFGLSVVLLGLSACSSSVVRTEGAASRPAVKPQPRISQPKYGASYVVQRGDTVYRIATGNGITPLDLALWNNIPPPYTIYPGQRLRLYPGGLAPAAGSRSPVAARPGTPPPRPVTPVPPASQLSWQWPVSGGQIVSTYLANDPTRQGIDIAGNGGEAVRAANAGVVVYSGSGLVGYGELIIVKHNDQWLSAYGHNRKRLVSEGAVVKAGQQIGELGGTGAPRNMLHFEIRLNGKPVDPQAYLPKR